MTRNTQSHQPNTCSKSIEETLEKDMKIFKVNYKDTRSHLKSLTSVSIVAIVGFEQQTFDGITETQVSFSFCFINNWSEKMCL